MNSFSVTVHCTIVYWLFNVYEQTQPKLDLNQSMKLNPVFKP